MSDIDNDEINDRIRRRAHEIWEREGQPHGRDQEHWTQAVAEIRAEMNRASGPAEEAAPAEIPRRKRAAPTKSKTTRAAAESLSAIAGTGASAANVSASGGTAATAEPPKKVRAARTPRSGRKDASPG